MKICDDLRQAVLQAAIQGKLTPQRKEDGDARELLKQIAAEKAKLIKEKKIKKEKPLLEITEDEIPFEVPENWVWVRLGDIILYDLGGGTPSKQEVTYWAKGDIPWMTVKDYPKNSIFVSDTSEHITEKGLNNSSTNLIIKNSIIVCTRVGLGKICINEVPVAINQDLRALFFPCCINKMFFIHFYKTVLVEGKGTTVKGIKRDELLNLLVPIPPYAEQQRVVAKVEKLMAEIDELEKVENELNALKAAFPGDMKAALLEAAMQGRLTTQRKEDGDARDLLKQIAKEKAHLVKDKKVKKEELLPEIAEDEIPFDIPDNWVWVKLGDLTIKDIKRGKSPVYTNKSSVMVFAQKCNVKAGGINMLLAQYLDEARLDKYPESEFLLNNDIVINSTGTGTMGRVGLFRDTDRIDEMRIVPDSHVTVIRASNLINPKYLYYYLHKSQSIFEENGDGSTNQKELKAKYLNSFCVPLPPLAEQKRIVAKLERLLPLCDGLAEEELEKLLD